MGLMISSFEALTLLPPKQETFRCFRRYDSLFVKAGQNLETVSSLAGEHYTADLGYREMEKSKQLGFLIGVYWFPVTKARVNKMLGKYNLMVGEIEKASPAAG